ncbi:S-methyl-5-thioribose-1-phosphate isomerase [Geminicoccus harenae]|uniref:S-methyl-5-thioribose-1-phosphate isomerase n=1 Tax=Geminicoccus harenae TaxID=2498453 RepID=UPI00168AA20F|nr:S-methyl-5-thioribose-1-phosphate isomerase [Geminicoccus harenae]
MRIEGRPYRTIWTEADRKVRVIDQTRLPHEFVVADLPDLEAAAAAIETMLVRGAPLIGGTAAYGMALAMLADPSDAGVEQAYQRLMRTRPTAVNLRWGLERMRAVLLAEARSGRVDRAFAEAAAICDEDVEICAAIGRHGLDLIREVAKRKGGGPVNVLTHCNAGWLATIDRGTATAPVYAAREEGIDLHVWVDETRPRNQGASLTAYELLHEEVPHTIIADNVGGHLMQHGQVDLCIVGTDRTTRTGDVANKIGTYLKALAADANEVPFYVALPSTTIDWRIRDGVKEIPIEQRADRELTHVTGRDALGKLHTVQITNPGSPGGNWAFDVTPARYVTGLITERGVAAAKEESLVAMFPEQAKGG